MTPTGKGRARQQALFDFLGEYPVATTNQLADLIWGGDQRLARAHLLKYVRDGQLQRFPHPLYRNGAYVYAQSEAQPDPLAISRLLDEVAFHVALTASGARVVRRMQWDVQFTPDQTVVRHGDVLAVDYHVTGSYRNAQDYRRFIENRAYAQCHWWRPDGRIGLLVITPPQAADPTRASIQAHAVASLAWKVSTLEESMRNPWPWVTTPAGKDVGGQEAPSLQVQGAASILQRTTGECQSRKDLTWSERMRTRR